MSKPLVVSIAALLLSVVAVLRSWSTAGEGPVDDARAEPAPGQARAVDDVAELAERVAALEAEVRRLRATSTSRGSGPAPRARLLSGASETGAGEGAREESAASDELDLEDPEVRERVGELVGEALRRQEEQRWEARRARWAERQDERLAELAEKAGLDEEQSRKLSALLAAEREEIGALAQKAREEMRWREMRREVREVRQRTDENAAALLDDEQLEHYRAMRDEEPFGRGRRRGERGQER